MFANLWKRTEEAATTEEFEFCIPRQNRQLLRFNGNLQFQSIGSELPDYRPGDPFHNLRIYKLKSSGYACVVEFHCNSDLSFVEASTVDSMADIDDFFCLHAGDYFHHMDLGSDEEVEQNKELEQRVLKGYDRQLLEVSKHLSIYAPDMANR